MENMKIKNHTHTCIPNRSLAMHKDSHMVAKTKPPKIRIIHIFAPEIIKTDAENFRELVQKLTGKPSGEVNKSKKKPLEKRKRLEESSSSSGSGMSEDHRVVMAKKIEVRNNNTNNNYSYNNNNGFCGGDVARDRVKEELLEIESSGGYLGGFSDLDGFIYGIGEFPVDATQMMMQGF